LDEVARLISREAEEDMNAIDVARVEADRMAGFGGAVSELQEVVGKLRRTGHFARTLQAEDEQVEYETVILEDEGGELKTTN
jgi:hypothetical protein